jgi:predicted phosphoadenosine phosphosulfate sulfurtransferase
VSYAATDPKSAINFAMESLQVPAYQTNAVADITAIWAAQEPQKASQWTQQLPDGDARRIALSQLIHVWGTNDPRAVAAWIGGMPQNSLRDEAIHFFLSTPGSARFFDAPTRLR